MFSQIGTNLFLGMVISVFHSPSMGGEKITLSISGLGMVHLTVKGYFSHVWFLTPPSTSLFPSLSQTKSITSLDIFPQSGFRFDAANLHRYSTCLKISHVLNGPRLTLGRMLRLHIQCASPNTRNSYHARLAPLLVSGKIANSFIDEEAHLPQANLPSGTSLLHFERVPAPL